MNKQARSRKFTAKQSARLAAYFAAGVGASMAATSTSDAAIITIDIGPTGFDIGGINGGVKPGYYRAYANFPFNGAGYLYIQNAYAYGSQPSYTGLGGRYDNIKFAHTFKQLASPINFSYGQSIDSSSSFSGIPADTVFLRSDPDSGSITSPFFAFAQYPMVGIAESARSTGNGLRNLPTSGYCAARGCADIMSLYEQTTSSPQTS